MNKHRRPFAPVFLLTTLSAVLLGLTTACGGTSAPSAGSSSETPSSSASSSGSSQDAQYVMQAHQSNLAEIAAGQLAQQKGTSQAVKDLGARFVADHTTLDQSLQQVASKLGLSLPSAPNTEQQALAQQYTAASGPAFDTLFVTTQMAAHMKTMQAGQAELSSGTDATVKAAAQNAAPVIASHGTMLDQAAQSLGLPNRMASGSPSPTAS